MKRLLFFICTLLCANVLSAQGFWEGDLKYWVIGAGKVTVDDCDTSATSVNIPSSVTHNWNDGSVITYSVTSIDPLAFSFCDGLTSVTIPNSVTSIEDNAFWYCSSLTSIDIPNSVTSIGQEAFRDCSSLTSVTIPNSVDTISGGMFSGCSSLTSVTIPNSITSIGYRAFEDCSSLTSVTIPNSVTSIGGYAFIGCSLTTLNFNAINCNNFDYDYLPFSHCPISTINIGNSVQRIPDNFARDLDSLTSVTIGNSVTSIGARAFALCDDLTSITIPNSVTSIGDFAFYGCSSLTSVTIPNSVTSIGECAFRDCSSLTYVTIGNSVTSIEGQAFWDCSSLTSVTCLAETAPSLGNTAFYFTPSTKVLNIPCGSDYSSWESATTWASIDCIRFTIGDLTYEVISETEVKVQACTESATSVVIPETVTYQGTTYGVTSIGEWAFYDCSSLTSVTIPNSVTSIGQAAFYYCSSLTSVTIPNSVTSIGNYAFYYCSNLTSVTIPNSVTSIGEWTFRRCSSLTSVTIPNSVTSIGGYAFGDCSSLTSMTIPNSVTSIGEWAFWRCSSLSSVNIGNSVSSIELGTFDSCINLTSVTIGNSVTSIGKQAFCFCYNLSAIDIPNSVTSIGQSAFHDCNSLSSVNIGNSVTSIGDYAFYSCLSLTSVTIPNSVSSIGYGAFAVCNTLSSVTCLANTPPSLGDYVFYNTPSNKILNVNCGLKDDYISSWGNAFDSNNIFEMYQYNVVATVNNEEFGSVAVENNCSTATLSATANEGYSFLNWNDGNTENPRVVSLTSDTSFVANFVISTVNTDITATICQGQTYTENGFNVSEAGIYTQTLTAINGADSIVTLTLNVNPIYNTELSATICEGSVYTENNFNVSEAGVYTQTLTSVNGCDSIVTLTLNVNPIFNTELSAIICEGQVYDENGFNVSEAGVYTQTLTSANGCDSIVTLTLNVNPIYNTELTATICQGSVYTENNFNVSEAGVYTQTLQTVNGCDSIVTLTLNVNPTFDTELTATICQGQVYDENGFNVSEAGVYTQTLTSANGCDSIVTLTVSVNPTFDTTINATINPGETYSEFGFNESEAGTYVQNLPTEAGCDSTITLVLSVNSSLLEADIEEISFYPNPTKDKITFSQAIENLEVIDLTGKVIFTFTNVKTINIESLPSGAYYLRLTNEEIQSFRKFIKQ